MPIEIECPMPALFKLFDVNTISGDMVREAPGDATMRFPGFQQRLEKRHLPVVEMLETILVTFGSGVAINLFSNWLYDKLKSAKVKRIRINRSEIEVTPDGILKAISESIEIDHLKK